MLRCEVFPRTCTARCTCPPTSGYPLKYVHELVHVCHVPLRYDILSSSGACTACFAKDTFSCHCPRVSIYVTLMHLASIVRCIWGRAGRCQPFLKWNPHFSCCLASYSSDKTISKLEHGRQTAPYGKTEKFNKHNVGTKARLVRFHTWFQIDAAKFRTEF